MKKVSPNKKYKPDTTKTKFLDCHVQWDVTKVKSAEGAIFIEGYANTNDKDRVGDVVLPSAFKASLPTYMENPVLLYQHNWDMVLGNIVAADVTDKGLYVKGKLSNAKDVEDVKTKILEGALRTFSIGYNETDAVYDERTKTNVIKELELLEISVVTIPANSASKFTVVQQEKNETNEMEKSIESYGDGFLGYLAHVIKDLDDVEEITVDFIQHLHGIYNDFNGQPPTKVKVERGQDESLGDCVSRAIPVLMNEGKDQEQAIAIAYSVCEKSAPKKEDAESTKEAPKKEGASNVDPAPEEIEMSPELAHRERVRDSALKAANESMKFLKEAHVKAMDNGVCDEVKGYLKSYSNCVEEADVAHKAFSEQKELDKGGAGSGGARAGAGRHRIFGSNDKPSSSDKPSSELPESALEFVEDPDSLHMESAAKIFNAFADENLGASTLSFVAGLSEKDQMKIADQVSKFAGKDKLTILYGEGDADGELIDNDNFADNHKVDSTSKYKDPNSASGVVGTVGVEKGSINGVETIGLGVIDSPHPEPMFTFIRSGDADKIKK